MNGCHNRKDFRPSYPAQDGWYMDGVTRTPRLVPVKFSMTKDCQYTFTELGQKDAGCLGCNRRKEANEG